MPDYEGQDVTDVVLCLRDWNITRMSHKAHSYLDENRQNRENVETELIREAILKQLDCRRVHCVSYEGLCGPFGRLVLSELLIHLGLLTATYPWETFIPQDGNRKYLK